MAIGIQQLKQSDIGRRVLYVPQHGNSEAGRIKSWNDKFIFVVYKCDEDWDNYQNYTAAGTKPEDLRFLD